MRSFDAAGASEPAAEARPEGSSNWQPLFAQLVRGAPGFLAYLEGPRHVFKLVNDGYRNLVGERELIGLSVTEAFPELVDSVFCPLLDDVFASGQPQVGRRVALQLRNADGSSQDEQFIDFTFEPVLGTQGAPLGILARGHDMTELVLTEQRLEAKAQELALIKRISDTALSFSTDLTYVFDADGRMTYANQALLRLWGMKLRQVSGKALFELPLDAGLAVRLQRDLARVLESRTAIQGEEYYRAPSGRGGWYEHQLNPVCDASGKVVCVAGSTRDVTARVEQDRKMAQLMASERAARLEAERAGRVKDEFLATLSHELRTPLHSIMGWAEVLRSGRLTPEKTSQGLERIILNGKAQGQLISDLLDMNAIASAKVRLNLQRVPLLKPLSAALEAVAPEAEAKGVLIVPPTSGSDVVIDCDPDRLQQVFWNLLVNAVKFTPAGGTIAVALALDDGDPERVRVGIADSGCGIEPSFLPHLFQRFSQADGSPTRRYGGLGLGLSICKTLEEMHGGAIEAHSDGVGQGSTFLVTLKHSRATVVTARESTWGESKPMGLLADGTRPSLQGLHVLVVDDDADARRLVLHLMEDYGASVVEADSADQALEALAVIDFALLISDIGMPDKDGYTLMRQIRSAPEPRLRSLPAIALTAFARPEDRTVALNAGFDAYLSKPAEPFQIIRTALAVMARRDGR